MCDQGSTYHILAKVGAKHECESGNHVGTLGSVTAEANDGELLLGAEHDEVGAKDNAAALARVVIHLTSSVVRYTERHHARPVAGRL